MCDPGGVDLRAVENEGANGGLRAVGDEGVQCDGDAHGDEPHDAHQEYDAPRHEHHNSHCERSNKYGVDLLSDELCDAHQEHEYDR